MFIHMYISDGRQNRLAYNQVLKMLTKFDIILAVPEIWLHEFTILCLLLLAYPVQPHM